MGPQSREQGLGRQAVSETPGSVPVGAGEGQSVCCPLLPPTTGTLNQLQTVPCG